MNTDHINYQQQIAQSVHEEKDQELIETTGNQNSSSSSPLSLSPSPPKSNSLTINEDYQRLTQHSDNSNNNNILTPIERRERLLTLIIIALIALLTGKTKQNFFSLETTNSIFRHRY